ncbi:MAG: restriction endonuclease subunit S [Armatimonadota bacterium]
MIEKKDYGMRTVEAQKDLHLLKLVEPGDYVISLRSFQGGIEYAHKRGIISPAYTILKPGPDVRRGFFEHYFKSAPFVGAMSLFVTGIREGQNIDYVRLSRAYMPVPPLEEQDQIGRFVRHLDSKVNRLIKAKRRLIELLNEQKQAIIHHTVTRGLDPTAPLKPSGIDWLGDVPEHWTIRKVSRTFRTTGSGTTPSTGNRTYYDEGEIPWVITGDLKNCELHTTSKFVTPHALQDCSALKMFPAGSVIVAMYGATIGKVGLLRIPACVNQACCVLANSPFMSPEYAAQLFIAFRDDIVRLGVGGGQPNISQDIIKQLRLPVPPLQEQDDILKVVGESTHGFDQAISKASSEIDFIREYRTRLVADVVTGQLDVRPHPWANTEIGESTEAITHDAELEDDLEETDDVLEEAGV